MDNNTTTNFSDVFKDNFLSGFSLSTQNLTLPNVLISLGIAFLLGMVIYFIYKKTYRGVLYSHSFNLSLIMLSMVTTLVIMCISSAPALSLGMVGALSIVRFRTAVKDPMDTVYMFWAIAVGITVGANFILFSIIGTLVIAVILLVLSFTSNQTGQNYLLVVHYDDRYAKEVTNAVNKMVPRYRLKSKTATRNGVEMTLELRLQGNRSNIVDNLLGIPGVMDATLVAFQNEIA
ncbi:MAG TPA: DUF4956 domain-containing protein [Candidatus Spyradocola merdavium]|nr:DUF4956 domain-containing protein [Candidatus Spyradocola merdavium]